MNEPVKLALFVIIILLVGLLWHVVASAEPPSSAQEWLLQQVPQTPPPMPKCYQARTRPGRWDVMCISEMQWFEIQKNKRTNQK
jgi:hypothetical protein